MKTLTMSLLNQKEGVYYCQEGDTIASIAKTFSTSKELIVKDNHLTSEVKKGDCIYIKRSKKVYTVMVGDTPETVAKNLGVSVDEMFRINRINYVYPFMQVVGYD